MRIHWSMRWQDSMSREDYMARVITESVHEETTPPKDLKTPIKDMFKKVENYGEPLLSHELLRKRKKVKSVG